MPELNVLDQGFLQSYSILVSNDMGQVILFVFSLNHKSNIAHISAF